VFHHYKKYGQSFPVTNLVDGKIPIVPVFGLVQAAQLLNVAKRSRKTRSITKSTGKCENFSSW
jgi:hypothetical protein